MEEVYTEKSRILAIPSNQPREAGAVLQVVALVLAMLALVVAAVAEVVS